MRSLRSMWSNKKKTGDGLSGLVGIGAQRNPDTLPDTFHDGELHRKGSLAGVVFC